MKKLLWFLLVFSAKPSDSMKLAAIAISQIIRDFYIDRSVQFDLIVQEEKKGVLSDLVDEIGNSHGNFPYKTREVSRRKDVIEVHQPAILLFDTLRSYQDFHARAVLRNRWSKQFYILVYILNSDRRNMEVKVDLEGISRFESIITHSSKTTLRLETYLTFQQPKCRQWKQIEINRFTIETRKWKNQEFFPEKFHNFNGCDLVLLVRPQQSFFVDTFFDDAEISYKIRGFGPRFFNEIGQHLNFSTNIYTYIEYYIKLSKNISLDVDLELEFSAFRHLPYHIYLKENCLTFPIATSEELIIISRSVPYTQLEKFYLPFDDETWICLAVTFSTAIVVIVLLGCARKDVRYFVIGRRVQTPMVNLVNVWFGGGLTSQPGRNFARFILTMYILFCLIIRTAYQSKQFEFMIKEMRKPDIKTIDEFIDKNYTLHSVPGTIDLYEAMDFKKRINKAADDHRIFKVKKPSVIEDFFEKLLFDGANRGFLIVDDFMLTSISNLTNGRFKYTKLEQRIAFNHKGILFPKYHFFYEQFNEKIVQLVESGLAKKFVEDALPKFQKSDEDGPVVLELQHLGDGFKIVLTFLLISCVFFILELIAASYRRYCALHGSKIAENILKMHTI